jgi:VWFA-related protein
VAVAEPGQSPADDRIQGPTFRTEVNYVRVDAFITRDGKPVTDLGLEDFEILDRGVPQKIAQFEYVQVRGNLAQDTRREPNTVAESREMVRDPRARVFVLFLDTRHVGAATSRTISKPLIDLLDNLIGTDDLVAVMTSDMSAGDVTFGRKTVALQTMLDRTWWGQSDRILATDPVEEQYQFCYPSSPQDRSGTSSLARELIDRRRETMTFDALGQLVRYLRDAREERKALITITTGWRLFKPDLSLLAARSGDSRNVPPPVLLPLGAAGRRDDQSIATAAMLVECERDRQSLAMVDNELRFRELMDRANRANTSFYPVDPRGLVVFDSDIGPDAPPSPEEDRARIRERQLSLRELAERTDGLAVVNTNNIGGSLRRVVEDLSSYYLLGYYATGVEMDGRFHELTVRVKRPGVDARARRGYLAPGPGDVPAPTSAVDPGAGLSPGETARTRGFELALGSLGGLAREMPLRVQVAARWAPGGSAAFQVVGETGRAEEWAEGAQVELTLTAADGRALGTGQASLEPGARRFDVTLAPDTPVAPGDFTVRVRARGQAPGSLPTTDSVPVSLPDAPDGSGALFLRRGPSTGNREVSTADLRFRRNERLRAELPWRAGETPTARLLDRAGRALAVPVATSVRDAGDGTWRVAAEVALSPLAAGDYVIEVSRAGPPGGESRVLFAGFRVVP